MDCVNHIETPAKFFCQNCGKPLCDACARRGALGELFCEPCLAAHTAGQSSTQVPPPNPGAYYAYPPPPSSGPNPAVATALGFIPGVGAMYNGQFLKGLIHVGIFAVLCWLADRFDYVGILIAAWIVYQAFEANHTARAIRDGLPVPDPLGFNDLSSRFTPNAQTYTPPLAAGFTPNEPVPPQPPYAETWQGYAPTAPSVTPPVPPRGTPIHMGAVALIVIGCIFLLDNLGWFAHRVMAYGWPILLIALGVWLIFRRRQGGC